MGLGFGFVVPKFNELRNQWEPWDTSNLMFPICKGAATEAECQKICNEENTVWWDENHNIVYKRSQWKNWDAINSIAKMLLEDDIDGVPYIDTNLKKNIIPNLFTRLAHFRKRFSDKEYSKYYTLLREECE